MERQHRLWILEAALVASLLIIINSSASSAQSMSTDQATVSQSATATSVYSRAKSRFAQRNPSKLVLTGTASYISGKDQQGGPIILTVEDTGAYQLEFKSSNGDVITESASKMDGHRACTWSRGNGQHTSTGSSCWVPAAWFLPHLSFTDTYAKKLQVADDGVDHDRRAMLHLNMAPEAVGASDRFKADLIRWSTFKLVLDTSTQLPSEANYKTYPDGGTKIAITRKVVFSGYLQTDGVEIPRHIQRYVNGSPDWDITISSAAVTF